MAYRVYTMLCSDSLLTLCDKDSPQILQLSAPSIVRVALHIVHNINVEPCVVSIAVRVALHIVHNINVEPCVVSIAVRVALHIVHNINVEPCVVSIAVRVALHIVHNINVEPCVVSIAVRVALHIVHNINVEPCVVRGKFVCLIIHNNFVLLYIHRSCYGEVTTSSCSIDPLPCVGGLMTSHAMWVNSGTAL